MYAPPATSFLSARPVWFAGREREMNFFAGFRARFVADADQTVATLRFTGASICRVFLNGEFLAYGPARAAHGFFCVDAIDLAGRLRAGENWIAAEVAAYNVPAYYLLEQPAFFQAEVVAADGTVLASTRPSGAEGEGTAFEGAALGSRVQKAVRLSYQRPFHESWRLAPGWTDWRTGAGAFDSAPLALAKADRTLLARRVPLPDYAVREAAGVVASGTIAEPPEGFCFCREGEIPGETPEAAQRRRWVLHCSHEPGKGCFAADELDEIEREAIEYLKGSVSTPDAKPVRDGEIPPHAYRIYDFGLNDSGFPRLALELDGPGRVYLAFDEILSEGDVKTTRLGINAFVALDFAAAGVYEFEFFEPQTCRYLKVATRGTACSVRSVSLREYGNPDCFRASFDSSDRDLNRIFEAARQTFRQNAVDLFTDCPSRERAGWLCDSFFEGRAAADLCGDTTIETAFLENYLLPPAFRDIDAGMLPMCYPSDHWNHNYIPNWAMWFVIELGEYPERGGDPALVEALRTRVLALLDFLARYRNADGLLEKLPRWVFVEWSRANDLVQDVNYPSNMTYAAVLETAGRLYGLPALAEEAERVRETIRRQSFDGEFFRDHAVRQDDGSLRVEPDRTEACQYYAFFFGTATPGRYPALWRTLRDDFGPDRKATGLHPDVAFANAFIGNYLRFELLSREGLAAQILDESKGYFAKMADLTGTLWENDSPRASCCHGFASHLASVFFRDLLGIRSIDLRGKVVRMRRVDLALDRCEGARPVPGGAVRVRWTRGSAGAECSVEAPSGYTVIWE